MKKLVLLSAFVASISMYGQDTLSVHPKMDAIKKLSLRHNVEVAKSGVRYSSKTYTEIYEAVTDSIVYKFGLEFTLDSTFVREVPMENCDRRVYDMMQLTTKNALKQKEQRKKDTINFLDNYSSSYEVWRLFMQYGLIK